MKSNLVFKTLSHGHDDSQRSKEHEMDVLFMCVDKATLLDLCDLFPQTADNIKKRSLERRNKFISQRNENSKAYDEKMKAQGKED